jgi:uncharacterized protein (UPF0212 family)
MAARLALEDPEVEDQKRRTISEGQILEFVGLPTVDVQLGTLLAPQTLLRPIPPLGVEVDLAAVVLGLEMRVFESSTSVIK